ncbi:MAG TPA: alkene reductase [Rhizomicrobium sp.]|nr:alkene reductase [Rhizomicrobium sp.]
MRNYRFLLSAGRVGDIVLRNRMIMSPMTRFRVTETGVPSDLNIIYYGQRASAGLIISEGTYSEPKGRLTPRTAGLHTEEHVSAWRAITDAVHEKQGRMFVQLCHGGRVSHPLLQPDGELPVAPSAIAKTGQVRIRENETEGVIKVDAPIPRALDLPEITSIVEEFGRATERAVTAGFDGVELHAASGLLHQQFLTTTANVRSDRYGGSPLNRCRFVIETLEAMSAVRGSGRVGIKIAPNFAYNGTDMPMRDIIDTYSLLVEELKRLDLGYVHVQYPPWGLFSGPKSFNPIMFVRPLYKGTLIGAGEFNRDTAEDMLAAGHSDFIAFGRRFIANPDLPARIAAGAEENAWDEATLYTPTPEGFIDYPTLSH